jgi:hypothetical protein
MEDDVNVNGVFDGGCCNLWEIVGVSDDPVWGDFPEKVFEGRKMEVGAYQSACMTKSHVAAREAEENSQGYLNNYDDLRIFLEENPGADVLLGLTSGATADDWITTWGSDLDTHYKMIIKTSCVEDIGLMDRNRLKLDNANMLVASVMTLAAVAVANI